MAKDCNLITTIIGFIFTLMGVVLGAFLHKIINSGKLKIFKKCLSIEYAESDGGAGFRGKSKFTPETKFASINLELDFYNSASEPKIARDINCQVGNQNLSFYNGSSEFIVLNVPPKTILNFKLNVKVEKKLEMLERSMIYLNYKTDKNVAKRFKLK